MIIYKCDICGKKEIAEQGRAPKNWNYWDIPSMKGEVCDVCLKAHNEIKEEEYERYLHRVEKRLRQYTPEAQLDEQ